MALIETGDLRSKKVYVAGAIRAKKLREERKRQSDLGEPGRPGGLLPFIRYFWHILEPATPFVEGWVVEAIAMHLEAVTRGEIKRLLINVSPGCMKSLLVNVFWPAWEWTAAGKPSERYVTFSYAAHLTLRDNAKFRDVVQSWQMQELWGHVFKLKKNGEIKPENDKTGWKFASSIGGVGTGERGGRVLADDLHSVKSAESEQVRGETVRWVREGMSNRLNDMANDVIIGIGQRVHEEDASAAMLSEGDYVHLNIPMEYDPGRHCATPIGWEDPRTEEGELCWPERFPKAVVQKLKTTLGPYAYSAQYQQAPSPRGGGIIKREWWQLWEEPAFPVCRYRWASADTAYTEKEANDPTGFTVWGLFEIQGQPNIILMDAWRKRLELHIPAKWIEEGSPETRMQSVMRWKKAAWAEYKRATETGQTRPEPLIDPRMEPWASYIKGGHNQAERWPGETYAIWTLRTQSKWGLCEWISHSCRRFQVDELVIEGKASGLSVAQELRRLNGNEGWGIRTTTPEGDKVARAYAVQPMFSAGLVWAPEREWSEMVIEEVSSFPKGRYKDLTDATSQALKYIRDIGLLLRPEERQFMADMSARYVPPSTPLYDV